ncbi:MAG TPA: heme biosynthesis HemY N-terminal domain-containing protein [Acetobacteraceae bacterium]|jgi:HemY protein|nr:heme biosynthesis HemY N-terminal domain-containing protein [Acetobacteraceae bacterium]
MRRILFAVVAAAVVLAVAWALAGLPGQLTATVGDITFEAATPVVALGLLLGFVLLYALFRLLGAVVRLPRTLRRRAAVRRRKAGDAATTRTLLALAAGETGEARREAGRARRYLGDTPATLLLAAEAGRIAGRTDESEAAFRALAERDDAAFLGLRGLLRHAVEREDWQEAAVLARRAEAVQPGAAWLRRERARLAVRSEKWSDALALADPDTPKAALATGAAEAEADAGRATRLAKEAWQDDPSLAPAALAYARCLRAAGRESRALAAIRHSWSIAPHPELATFALAPVTDPLARMQAARKLTEANPEHAESRLLLARSALDAGLTGEARRYAEAARSVGLKQRRLWLLLADIDEAEGIDQRESLRHATTAEPDPTWRCGACHTAHAEWHPACPDCFTVGSLRWSAGGPTAAPILQAPAAVTLLP